MLEFDAGGASAAARLFVELALALVDEPLGLALLLEPFLALVLTFVTCFLPLERLVGPAGASSTSGTAALPLLNLLERRVVSSRPS